MTKIVHLLSGGLDSVTMLYWLKSLGLIVQCLLFDYKQRHVQELLFARGHCRKLGVLWQAMELPALNGLTEDNWVVPNRNAVMLSIAVNVAVQGGYDTVTIGCNQDDAAMFQDCTPAFIEAMNGAVKAAGYSVRIEAPYITKQKWEIVRLAKKFSVPMNEIWTCYRGGSKPCGECPACKKLAEALA